MRKFFGLLFTLTILFVYSNIVLAAFNPGDLATVELVADFTSEATDYFSIELKEFSTDVSTTTINWNIQDVNLKQSTPQWKWSTTYAVVKSTITDPRVSYYLYQKNTQSTDYKAEDARTVQVYSSSTTFAYSGLVNRASHGGEDGGYVALSYLFTVDKLTSSDLERDYDPEIMTPSGDKVARYCTDEADYVAHYDSEHHETSRESNFKKEYAVIACANSGGIVFGPYAEDGSYAPWCPVAVQQSKTAYMYFGGNFMFVSRGYVFGSDQIFIEKVVE